MALHFHGIAIPEQPSSCSRLQVSNLTNTRTAKAFEWFSAEVTRFNGQGNRPRVALFTLMLKGHSFTWNTLVSILNTQGNTVQSNKIYFALNEIS